ncbi:MAG TPA: hypothetical protein PKN96_11965, partial [Flavobacterium sp.]|uniref:hypothetical protein n=1 Tax=Flavobacterium sp. TaxID=239 RepID=UPI002BFEACC0
KSIEYFFIYWSSVWGLNFVFEVQKIFQAFSTAGIFISKAHSEKEIQLAQMCLWSTEALISKTPF